MACDKPACEGHDHGHDHHEHKHEHAVSDLQT